MQTTKYQLFEEFLKEQHAKDYHGTDDDMPEAFEHWIETLDAEEIIRFADDAVFEAYNRGLHRGKDIVLETIKTV